MTELGYRDYLEALQRYRVEHPFQPHLLMASYLVDYPFANRLFPGSLDVWSGSRSWADGHPDGRRCGFSAAQARALRHLRNGGSHVLIYIHKEEALADVERQYPAEHYVLVDDKLRILTAVKNAWTDRVTTVFVRQGQFAHDPRAQATCPAAGPHRQPHR